MTLHRRALLAVASAALAAPAHAETTARDFSFDGIDGGTLDLGALRGRVLLVVNTASYCGYTYQYKALEALFAARAQAGLTVVGVPSQDFDQEKDSNGEVKSFCELTFGVKFPMAGITHVRGPEAHPFYRWLAQTQGGWQPEWNFYKALIGRDGRVAGLFASTDEPEGERVTAAITAALG